MATKYALAAVAASATMASARPSPPTAQIVGGTEASAGEFPWIVSLYLGGSHSCGGTLLNADTVLTAAHCSQSGTGRYTVAAGTNEWASPTAESAVSEVIVHPAYGVASSYDSDIAIWKLSTPIEESDVISYATLPSSGYAPADGDEVTVAGWGYEEEGGTVTDTLMKVTVPVVGNTECASAYGSGQITDTMFCAGLDEGGKDACQGDSGGPVMDTSGNVIGAVSWGNGCAQAGYPGVYANVGTLLDFVNENI